MEWSYRVGWESQDTYAVLSGLVYPELSSLSLSLGVDPVLQSSNCLIGSCGHRMSDTTLRKTRSSHPVLSVESSSSVTSRTRLCVQLAVKLTASTVGVLSLWVGLMQRKPLWGCTASTFLFWIFLLSMSCFASFPMVLYRLCALIIMIIIIILTIGPGSKIRYNRNCYISLLFRAPDAVDFWGSESYREEFLENSGACFSFLSFLVHWNSSRYCLSVCSFVRALKMMMMMFSRGRALIWPIEGPLWVFLH